MRFITLHEIDLPGDMFDEPAASQTVTASEITATFPVAGMNCVAILNNEGYEATLELPNNVLIIDLISDAIKDWYDYWFAPSRAGRDAVFYFPTQAAGVQATLTISSDSDAKCGLCVTGVARKIATTQYGVTVGIDDYSRYITDEFGETYLNAGRFAKRIDAPLYIETADMDRAYNHIVDNRGTSCIFDYNSYDAALETLHTSQDEYQTLIVFGFTEDFSITVPGPAISTVHHEAQGLT